MLGSLAEAAVFLSPLPHAAIRLSLTGPIGICTATSAANRSP
jgi:hypothetical protein